MNYYSGIDSIIDAWKHKHNLHVDTIFKDTQVRTTNVVSQAGERFQIWIDFPEGDTVCVHAWDYEAKWCDWKVPIAQLGEALDNAVLVVKSWMKPLM